MGNDVFYTLQRKYIRLAYGIQVVALDFDFVPTRMMLELSESAIQLKFEFHYISKFFRSSPKCWPAQFLKIFMKKMNFPNFIKDHFYDDLGCQGHQ